MQKLIIIRRISQSLFFFLFVYILWSTTYPLTGIISPQIVFKIDPLIMFVTALSERLIIGGLFFSFVMVILTLILGRFFCGWMCPMGTSIDFIGAFFPKKKKDLTLKAKKQISRPKFIILIIILLLALVQIQAAWILDPIVTVARVVSLNIIPGVTIAVDKTFQFIIQKFNLYGGVYDFYRDLKSGLLGINIHFFGNSLLTLLFFLSICFSAGIVLRLWCRMLCPLGAFYALNSKAALLTRRVGKCTRCGNCIRKCRMGAITSGIDYRKGECILCMDCIYYCPEKSTKFTFCGTRESVIASDQRERSNPSMNNKGITRAQFLLLMAPVVALLVSRSKKVFGLSLESKSHPVIRPPGALAEEQFINTCVRCGNCMKVCITNGLQPSVFESGTQGLWTPQLVPEIGYCEYNCTLCGEVCPTQAIPKLPVEEKKKQKLGLAVIDRNICYAWGGNKECIVCEEHCPISDKAIKVKAYTLNGVTMNRPFVDANLCIGCGICQNKCPVRPIRAIRVDSNNK